MGPRFAVILAADVIHLRPSADWIASAFNFAQEPDQRPALGHPDPHDHGNGHRDDQDVERQTHAGVVAKVVAAGRHDQVLDWWPIGVR